MPKNNFLLSMCAKEINKKTHKNWTCFCFRRKITLIAKLLGFTQKILRGWEGGFKS